MCFDVGSRVKVFWSPSGTLCPKARGLSPQHIWEQAPCVSAAWPCLSCPPKNCKCNATFQIRNVQAAADILYCWTSRIKTSEIEAVTSCTRWRACCFGTGLFATARVKSYHVVSSSETSRQNCPTSAGGRHGKSEPRSVGVLSNAHGITLLLQRTKAQEPQLSMCFDVGSRVKVFWSPSGTLCPKARGLSPQHIWELPVCPLRGHAYPAPQKAANAMQPSKSETYKQLLTYYIAELQESRRQK